MIPRLGRGLVSRARVLLFRFAEMPNAGAHKYALYTSRRLSLESLNVAGETRDLRFG